MLNYVLVITRKNQVLLNFLDVRVVVNGNIIYPLPREEPVVVTLSQKLESIVATDGFHISPPVTIDCFPRRPRHLHVVCAIDDGLIYAGFLVLAACYVVGLVSDIPVLKLCSFFPLLYFLFYFYFRRQAFLQIKAVA